MSDTQSKGADPGSPSDYQQPSVFARYGYYASVLRPGMTPAQITSAIQSLQQTSGGPLNQDFVTSLSPSEIQYFVANYKIVGSSSTNGENNRSGLDGKRVRRVILATVSGPGSEQPATRSMAKSCKQSMRLLKPLIAIQIIRRFTTRLPAMNVCLETRRQPEMPCASPAD